LLRVCFESRIFPAIPDSFIDRKEFNAFMLVQGCEVFMQPM
jgi:hypothetical protein